MAFRVAGRGPAPKPAGQRRTRHRPQRGEWQPTASTGWRHGPIPEPPEGLLEASIAVWRTWMSGWWAAHWVPQDLPGLYRVIRLYEQCESYDRDPYLAKETPKGDTVYVLKPNPSSELRQWMDNYGISTKGQQDRRWAPPKEDEEPKAKPTGRYAHLKVVSE